MIRTAQLRLSPRGEILEVSSDLPGAQVVLVFGSGGLLLDAAALSACRDRFPTALLVGCSTAGSILGDVSFDDVIVATAIEFEHTLVRCVTASLESGSRQAGMELGRALLGPDLVHALVLSEGLHVNGTELIGGLTATLPAVSVTGGLAGDGERMARTVIIKGDEVLPEHVLGIGFYGSRLEVGYGYEGGWGPLGPEREITRSDGNLLYELDGQDALSLYRRYLGEHAAGLPSTGLLFPLQVRPPEGGTPVVRTLLGIDETAGCIRFAGDVPQGHYARLMTASFGRLVAGAGSAADQATALLADRPELTLLVSCVGRRMLMRQRSDEELEAVRESAGPGSLVGFYSYGELCPDGLRRCELHNQTMTITCFREL